LTILGIDPAPSKKSIVFNGECFKSFSVKDLKEYLDSVDENVFIAWDAPLSGADESFSIRKIESFFYLRSKTAKHLEIPKGISTLGFSTCPHWTISQYIFAYPVMNYDYVCNLEWKLIMSENEINFNGAKQLTEIHPALSLWILLKNEINDELFLNSWQYKGRDENLDAITKRRQIIVDKLVELNFTKSIILVTTFLKDKMKHSDDYLDAFVCWLLAKKLLDGSFEVKIYGDELRGSFLLPYDKEIYNYWESQ